MSFNTKTTPTSPRATGNTSARTRGLSLLTGWRKGLTMERVYMSGTDHNLALTDIQAELLFETARTQKHLDDCIMSIIVQGNTSELKGL